MANPNITSEKQFIDVIKYRKIWFWITGLILVPCIVAMLYSIITSPNHSPIKLGIDFEGGTILQYQVDKKIEQNDINTIRVELEKIGIENPVIQGIANATVGDKENNFVSIKTPFIDEKSDMNDNLIAKYIVSVLEIIDKNAEHDAVFNNIAPTRFFRKGKSKIRVIL